MLVVKLAAGECYSQLCNLPWARLRNGVHAIPLELLNVITDCELDGVPMGRARAGTLCVKVASSAMVMMMIIDCRSASSATQRQGCISGATASGLMPS